MNNYNILSSELKEFINDFESWSLEERKKITVIGTCIIVDKLNDDVYTKYTDGVSRYIERHTSGRKKQLIALCILIRSLQQ